MMRVCHGTYPLKMCQEIRPRDTQYKSKRRQIIIVMRYEKVYD